MGTLTRGARMAVTVAALLALGVFLTAPVPTAGHGECWTSTVTGPWKNPNGTIGGGADSRCSTPVDWLDTDVRLLRKIGSYWSTVALGQFGKTYEATYDYDSVTPYTCVAAYYKVQAFATWREGHIDTHVGSTLTSPVRWISC